MNVDRARFNMIEQQIRPWDVLSPKVVDVLFRIRRENFVPPALRDLALADTELPLGNGEYMLAPRIEARALHALRLHATEKVLEVGTGSGYMAALLGSSAGQVSSVEIRREFIVDARTRLHAAAIQNVTVHEGDGLAGLPGDAPFDAIAVSGALHSVPQTLLDQLKIGGRMFVITGAAPAMRAQRITREGTDIWRTEDLFETVVPYLRETSGKHFEF